MQEKEMLILQRASAEDCQFLYKLRNDETVRRNSFQTERIPYEQHEAWFLRKMSDKNTRVYILRETGVRAGQVRVDIDGARAEISYALCMEARGRGLGRWMLTELEQQLVKEQACDELVAEVKRENIASQKIFRSLGYVESSKEFGYCYRKKIR